MKYLFLVFICSFCINSDLFAIKINEYYQLPKSISLTDGNYEKIDFTNAGFSGNHSNNPGLYSFFNLRKESNRKYNFEINKTEKLQSDDTLFVGPNEDTLKPENNWFYTGTILVVGKGKMIFDNVNVTIDADIVVWGDEAEIIADNSNLYFPQEYFYQRKMIVAGGAHVSLTNTTMDYNGLPHNLAITDSSVYTLKNVTMKGFTTCGLTNTAEINVDGCNETGEFIIEDSVNINFANAKTILLWHLVDKGSKFDISFPDGDKSVNWELNNLSPGLTNIFYNINLENCESVLWGLMPKTGSEIHIKDSKIRSIGVWFNGKDTTEITGLVNNSHYDYFLAPFSDRSLILENTDVQTWSLYPFDNTVINLKGCIVGEIGAFGRSYVTGTNFMVDGSGGYFFASDTSVVITTFAAATCNVRSERNGVMLFGYSAQTNGNIASIGSSIMIIVQSGLVESPIILENSVLWFANISEPANADINSSVPIIGSAWIDKTQTSFLMDFKKYYLSYQKDGSDEWVMIGDTLYEEKRNDVLGFWNTENMKPGAYQIRLTLVSNANDEFSVDAVKRINLLPKTLDVNDMNTIDEIGIYPNSATDYIEITNPLNCSEIRIYNTLSECVVAVETGLRPVSSERIDISGLPAGVYYIRIGNSINKFMVVR
ncbi:MAG: T9SS type A sorting domain-containing protein [Bacteroidetes bacterium]|nr:T9SS type A sorting domain-containing protein [Bacteroidota bacterium]